SKEIKSTPLHLQRKTQAPLLHGRPRPFLRPTLASFLQTPDSPSITFSSDISITTPRDPHSPVRNGSELPENVNSGGSWPHLSLTLFNQSVKVRFSQIFLLLHNFFVVSSKFGFSKNLNSWSPNRL
ncbi:hypothetical protein AABB24_025954, partial [Solanum stoloniferum]